ncbi:MAG: DUF3179 domain-containing protein [Candidatus Rokubacteria bacterium]|nr:DUF3179 domain-containing protein [Candidatus Rokubacteria bacterium]
MTARAAALAVVVAGALAAAPAATQPTRILAVPGPIDGTPVSVVLPPDAIRAIDAPPFLRGEAASQQMTADEPVLGLRLSGEARAYPLGYLSAHEIVNDRVGDVPIAVTW